MNLERSIEIWAGLDPQAVANGSPAQIVNALRDAKHDIAELHGYVEHYRSIYHEASKKLCDLSQRVYGKTKF